jgi:hypothetical protein
MQRLLLVHVLDRLLGELSASRSPPVPAADVVATTGPAVAEWAVEMEHEFGVLFAEACQPWLAQTLATAWDDLAEAPPAFVRGPRGGIAIGCASLVSPAPSAEPLSSQQPQQLWSWDDVRQRRSTLIGSINCRFSFTCGPLVEFFAYATAWLVRLHGPPIVQARGAALEDFEVLPRGLAQGNLFVSQADADAAVKAGTAIEPMLLGLDNNFHTSPSEKLILFPAIDDLTALHYGRMRESAEPCFCERVPYVAYVKNLMETACHEAMHVVQGMVGQADTSHFKLAIEHGAAVLETSMAVLVMRRCAVDATSSTDGDNNSTPAEASRCIPRLAQHAMRHVVPPGLAELVPAYACD